MYLNWQSYIQTRKPCELRNHPAAGTPIFVTCHLMQRYLSFGLTLLNQNSQIYLKWSIITRTQQTQRLLKWQVKIKKKIYPPCQQAKYNCDTQCVPSQKLKRACDYRGEVLHQNLTFKDTHKKNRDFYKKKKIYKEYTII